MFVNLRQLIMLSILPWCCNLIRNISGRIHARQCVHTVQMKGHGHTTATVIKRLRKCIFHKTYVYIPIYMYIH